MEIKQLRYFLEIWKLKSFSEAAKSCFITPQGIHVSISRLEEELGAKLFAHTNNGLRLTYAGEYLLPRAKDILDLSMETIDHFRHEAEKENSVSVLFVRGTVELLALPSIAEFKKNETNADVTFKVEQDLDCIQAVLAGSADMAVCSGPIHSRDLNKKLLFSRKNVLVINKNDPLAYKEQVSIDDLKRLDLALPRENVQVRNTVLSLCRDHGFEPEFIENDEPRTAFNCAEIGLQAGIVNEVSARKLLRDSQNVTIIPFDTPEMNWDIYLIKRKDAPQSCMARTYEACLLKTAKDV